MDTILAQQLSSMGGDVQLRKRNLLNLASCLTLQEVRELTCRLMKTEFRTDILARLPPELRLHIARSFDDIDVFPLLNVSRRWRELWFHPDMLKIVYQRCRYLNPGLLLPVAGEDPLDWAKRQYELIGRRHRRFLGEFSSASVVQHNVPDGPCWLEKDFRFVGIFDQNGPLHRLDNTANIVRCLRVPDLEHKELSSVLYEGRRLVWLTDSLPQPDDSLIVVEDLGSRTKKVYRSPFSQAYARGLKLLALGDKLVVAGSSRVIYVWHMETDRCSQVTLPHPPSCCVTRGETVAFLRRDSVLLWKEGRGIQAVNTDHVTEHTRGLIDAHPGLGSFNTLGIFFHPSDETTLFISACFSGLRLVAVHTFVMGEHTETYEINLRDNEQASQFRFSERHDAGATIACRPVKSVNSSGDFLVMQWKALRNGAGVDNLDNLDNIKPSDVTFLEIRFNVNARAFSLVHLALPDGTWGSLQTLGLGAFPLVPSWNDQIAFTLEVAKSRLSFVAIPVCQAATSHSVAPIYTLREPKDPGIKSRGLQLRRAITFQEHFPQAELEDAVRMFDCRPLTLETEVDQVYFVNGPSGSDTNPTELIKSLYTEASFILDLIWTRTRPGNDNQIRGPHRIFQDDEFIILFHRHGFIAWDFRTRTAVSGT